MIPFAGTSLIDIALEKLAQMDFVAHRYFGVAEDELKTRAARYASIEILHREPGAVQPGYHDHRKIYAHYRLIDSDYIFWLNPCHPLLQVNTVRRAVEYVRQTSHNSYTSVVPTTDWIFDQDGLPVTNKQASMLSSAHSPKFFRVAHAFHVFNKEFFLRDYQCWTLTRNDPALVEIPIEESYDVNDENEFAIAESIYRKRVGKA